MSSELARTFGDMKYLSNFLKLFITTICLVVFSISVGLGQNNAKGKISGVVTDSVTKAPVDFATVSIYKTGSATRSTVSVPILKARS